MKLDLFLDQTRSQLENSLTISFTPSASPHLQQAVHYSLLGGGKRLRPALVHAAALIVGSDPELWLTPAKALEMIHVYSLIHDDLPAMDDDDLRRGKPTNHKRFDEATAILAGDALQTEAFALIAKSPELTDAQVRQMVLVLSDSAGANGMVGGQMIDLQSEHKTLTLNELENLHALKTGALIQSALKLGALCQPNVSNDLLTALDTYGKALGLAFQITDDVLDITSSTEILGKPQGSDLQSDKSTYVSLLGLEGAKQKALEQTQIAVSTLKSIGLGEETTLWQLADYVIQREY